MTEQERDALWAKQAINAELARIATCHDDNPHRPDSEYWKALIRIASIVKGTGKPHFQPTRIVSEIHRQSPSSLRLKGNRQKDIDYLWSRAFNAAKPRYRGNR